MVRRLLGLPGRKRTLVPKLQPRLDLGIRGLLPAWRALFSRKELGNDVAAGLTVACVAIPLSLAIALASGVPPAVGLVTAIVAGIVCALFGGTPLQVSGPAAAMAVIVATLVEEYGLAVLLLIGLGTGVLQLFTGVFGLGRFIRLVPFPVIEGFTAGIGAIIVIGQLPLALGLPAPPQAHVTTVFTHITDLLGQTNWTAVALTLLTLAIIYGLPKLTKRVPAHLAAVAITSIVTATVGLDIATIGEIPRSLPMPRLPDFATEIPLKALLGSCFVVFAVASLETLLSAAAVDKMTDGPRSDPDQELIGQGLGNVASSLFGGIPITGVIARSGTNVQAGAKTRRSAIIHSLALLASVLLFANWIERIPIAALAGVLFSVAFRMLNPTGFRQLWRHSRPDGVVYAVTFVTIVFVDLLEGVQWGVVAALAIAAVRLNRPRLLSKAKRMGEHYLFTFEGPLTFLSSLDVTSIRDELGLLERNRYVVFDLYGVSTIDSTGSEMLGDLVDQARSCGLHPIVVGLTGSTHSSLSTRFGKDAERILVDDERSLAETLGASSANAEDRLSSGVDRYRATTRPRYSSLFEKLASGQAPHTLFITCSDSRINPNLITATEPGELFIVRDVGNIVPPGSTVQASAVSAAIDYAVGVLGVAKIVVCGHSGCGAIGALVSGAPLPSELRNLRAWLDRSEARQVLRGAPKTDDIDAVARHNALCQLDHLRTYPIVAEKLASGKLSLAAWFFDVATGEVEEWSNTIRRFVRVGTPTDDSSLHDLVPEPAQ